MAGSPIDIIVKDKVDVSIADNLRKIGQAAKEAGASVDNLNKSLGKKVDTSTSSQAATSISNATKIIQSSATGASNALNRMTSYSGSNLVNLTTSLSQVATRMTQATSAAQALALANANQAASAATAAAAATRAASSTGVLAGAVNTLRSGMAAVTGAIGSAKTALGKWSQQLQKSSNDASGLRSIMLQLSGAMGAKAVLDYADSYTTLQNKLVNVSESHGQVNAITSKMFDLANRTRSDVTTTTQSFTRFDRALKIMGKSQDESIRLTETVNKALIVSGATAQEASASMLQLSQAFNSGRLQGDEFRSVSENMPVVIDAIAKVTGKATSEIKKMSSEGKITATVLYDAFTYMQKTIDEKFARTIPTVSQSLTVLKNKAIEFFGEANKGLGITNMLSSAIMAIGNNLNKIVPILAAVGAGLLIYTARATTAVLITAVMGNKFTALLAVLAGVATYIASTSTVFTAETQKMSDGTTKTIAPAISMGSVFATAFQSMTTAAKEPTPYIDKLGKEINKNTDITKKASATVISAKAAEATGWMKFLEIVASVMDGIIYGVTYMVEVVKQGIKAFATILMGAATSIAMVIGYIKAAWAGGTLFPSKEEILKQSAPLFESIQKLHEKIGEIQDPGKKASAFVKNQGLSTQLKFYTDLAKEQAKQLKFEQDMELRKAGKGEGSAGDGKSAEKRADALKKVNLQLDNELSRMQMLLPQRELQQKMDQIEEQLAGKKITLHEREKTAIMEKLKAIQDFQKVQQAMDTMYQGVVGPMETYNAALKAADLLLEKGVLSQKQYNEQKLKASEAYKDATVLLRQENKALDDQMALLGLSIGDRAIESQMLAIRNELLKKGIDLKKEEYRADEAAYRAKLVQKATKEAIDGLQQENKAIKDQLDLLDVSYKKRDVAAKMQEKHNQLVKSGADMTSEAIKKELAAHKELLETLEKKSKLDAEMTRMLEDGQGVRDKFILQLEAINALSGNDDFSKGDKSDQITKLLSGMDIDTTGMQVALDARLALYKTHYEQLDKMREQELLSEQDYAMARVQIWEKEFRAKNQRAEAFFSGMAQLQGSNIKALSKLGKAAAITEALVNTYVGATKALAQGGFYGAAMAAVVVAQGMSQVAAIRAQGFASGGYTGDIPRTAEAGVVHGQEFVMNASATQRIGQADLYALQSGAARIQRNNANAGKGQAEVIRSVSGQGVQSVEKPQVNSNVILVLDPKMVGDYINTPDGEEAVIAMIRRNGDRVKTAMGVQ